MAARIWLGIDVGTSYSKIARIDDTGVITAKTMFVDSSDSNKGLIPSAVFYNSELKAIGFGKGALKMSESESGYLITEFKMKLETESSLVPGKDLRAEQVYEDYVNYLRRLYVQTYQHDGKNAPLASGTTLCTTHPAHRFKSKRIVGKVFESVENELRFDSLEEPAAVVQFLDNLRGNILQTKPITVIVIDSGGGTTDICVATAVYPWFGDRRKPFKVEWVDRLDIGGRDIDKEILLMLLEDQPRMNGSENILLQKIKNAKEKYDWSKDDDFVVNYEKKDYSIPKSKLVESMDIVIGKIIEKVDGYAEQYLNSKDSLFVLTGGNSKIPILERRLETKYSAIPRTKVPYGEMQFAVAKGAALYIKIKERIEWRIAFDLAFGYWKQGKRKYKNLWKKGMLTTERNRKKRIPVRYKQGEVGQIVKIVGKNTSVLAEIHIDIGQHIKSGTELLITFEINPSGYIQYSVHPVFDEDNYYQDIVHQHKVIAIDPIEV